MSIILFVITGCKKENDRPQWQVNVLGPLLHASLGVNNFIPDSLIFSDSTHAINIVYQNTLYNTNIDSLFLIPDTSIFTFFTSPIPTYTLVANSPFYGSNNNLILNIPGVELREVIIKSGYMYIQAQNKLNTDVKYTYTIPKATLNGNVFSFTVAMNAAPPGGITIYNQLFDMSHYKFDLTGAAGNSVNIISYNIAAQTDSGAATTTVLFGDTLVNIQAGFRDIIPYYAKGYLGQKEINEGSLSNNVNPFAAVNSGSIRLKDVTMKITVENNVGVDIQALIGQMQSVNTNTNSTVNLNAPQLINHTLNINRATETGNAAYPVNPSTYFIQLDRNNSNLVPFIENLPDRLNYSLSLNVNPLGNISGSTDFVFSDYLVNAKVRIDMPLAFAADHLTFADTSAFVIQNQPEFDAIGPGTFTLIADNGFPFEADLRILLLDNHNQLIDSIPVSTRIAAAPVDANFKVTGPKRTLIPVYVDEARKQRIINGGRAAIRASFTTPAFPQYIQIYTNYKLDLKLVADAAYLIH